MNNENKIILCLSFVLAILLGLENLPIFSKPAYGKVTFKQEVKINRPISNTRVIKLDSGEEYLTGLLTYREVKVEQHYYVSKGYITGKAEFSELEDASGRKTLFLFLVLAIYCLMILKIRIQNKVTENLLSALPVFYILLAYNMVYINIPL